MADKVSSYIVDPTSMAQPLFGSYDVAGNDSACLTFCSRYGRYGACPMQYKAEDKWRGIDLWRAQMECLADFTGQSRVNSSSEAGRSFRPPRLTATDMGAPLDDTKTVVLLRAYEGYPWDAARTLVRSMVRELSLETSGEYLVLLLVEVTSTEDDFWNSEDRYEQMLETVVPMEFRGMSVLWSMQQMKEEYQAAFEPQRLTTEGSVFQSYRSMWLPVQVFSRYHPQITRFINWEMDSHYIGDWLGFFERVQAWASNQPHSGLREQAERFYIQAKHGNWSTFRQGIRDPGRPQSSSHPHEGVGHAADLITLNPQFDPKGTKYVWKDDISGYSSEESTPDTVASIITASILSARLLQRMDNETQDGRLMASEMWPCTIARLAKLTQVYAPHPVYSTIAWPYNQADIVFNPCRYGSSGGCDRSPFGLGLEDPLMATTWYYMADAARKVWSQLQSSKERECVRPMLLHPVKPEDHENSAR